jgi:transposase
MAPQTQQPLSHWAILVHQRRGHWKAVVTIAAKNARLCWSMLQRGDAFKLPA